MHLGGQMSWFWLWQNLFFNQTGNRPLKKFVGLLYLHIFCRLKCHIDFFLIFLNIIAAFNDLIYFDVSSFLLALTCIFSFFCFCFFFRWKTLFCLNDFGLFYRLGDRISCRFNEKCFYAYLWIALNAKNRNRVYSWSFSWQLASFLFSFIWGLIGFGLFYVGLVAAYHLIWQPNEIFCVLRARGTY